MLSHLSPLHNQPRIHAYVYVPFSRDEISPEFLTLMYRFIIDREENFQILLHKECNLSKLPQGAKIYVLSHGYDISPDHTYDAVFWQEEVYYEQLKDISFEHWAYSVTAGIKGLSIDSVAQRMISDKMLDAKILNVKLWFCDPNYKADKIANKFMAHFRDKPLQLKVDYYLNCYLTGPEILTKNRLPSGMLFEEKNFQDKVEHHYNRLITAPQTQVNKMRKWAINSTTGEISRASAVRESLFNYLPTPKSVTTSSVEQALSNEECPSVAVSIHTQK